MPASARVPQPWKNGGGVTREVLVWPPQASMTDFDWRISMATVDAAGPFSAFDGIDRHLSVLSGQLRLTVDGVAHQLVVGQGLAFAGDAPASGEPLDGPVIDLNVMTRRGRFTALVTCIPPQVRLTPCDGQTVLLAIAATDVCSHKLKTYDAVWLDDWPTEGAVNGNSALIRIDIANT
nr:HutD family protein [Asticcacaulis machinosus]